MEHGNIAAAMIIFLRAMWMRKREMGREGGMKV
jgi:hypothetical protein